MDNEILLNSNRWSIDSIEGVIIILIILFLVYSISKKLIDFIWWCIGLLLFIQIGYILSLTSLNNTIPLSTIFRYDILSAIAQVFVGTKFSDILLWISKHLNTTITGAWDKICEYASLL